MNRILAFATASIVLAAYSSPASAAVAIFSAGYSLPETISQAPAGYGGFGGEYFVPDPGINGVGPNVVWAVPTGGGSPTLFYQEPSASSTGSYLGGLFLPSTFGAFGGNYIVGEGTLVQAFTPNAAVSTLTNVTSTGLSDLTTPAIAPSGFGTAGGNLFFTAQLGGAADTGGIIQINSSGQASVFYSSASLQPFGLAFAPTNFGAVGGNLLVSQDFGTSIVAINSAGQASIFATLPNASPSFGLRQMGFAPAGFGIYGGDLLVSVSGSSFGGGQVGALDVLNSSGQLVAVLLQGTSFSTFDPRGFVFTGANQILISDTGDPILIASPSDFGPATVPEPPSLVMLSPPLLLAGLAHLWMRRRVGTRSPQGNGLAATT